MRWKINKNFWAAVFTLTGTLVGAGILGLPYVFSKSGYLIGLGWLLFLGIVLIYVKLCLGEVILRTKGDYQLVGYARRYLGKWGKRLMFFAMVFGIYSALLAYLIGEGQSFSQLFTGGLDYAIYFGIGFWVIMTFLLQGGISGLKKIETWGVLGIIIIILFIFGLYFPQVQMENLSYINLSNIFIPFGVVFFALLGFSTLPEVKMEIRKQKRKYKKAIILGSVITIILYIVFSFIFVGKLGREITEVATLSFGPLIILLGIFTMFTSYFVLSFALKDMFKFDLRSSKFFIFLFVSGFPLVLYLILSYFNWLSFVGVLGIGGVVGGGLTGILILLMNKKAKKEGNRRPEYRMPLPRIILWLLVIVFVVGVFFELLL